MQTLRDSLGSVTGMRPLAAAVAAGAMIVSLAGCSAPAAPHLQAQVDDVRAPGTCESAYLTATSSMGGVRPVMMRYLAARASADAWTTVAANCVNRFAEGTLRSAQASYTAQSLASRLGLPDLSPEPVDYGEVSGFDIGSSTLSALSLAEDRAGFAVEVLAARGVSGATLAMSDNHKTAGQRLFSLSGADKDPRQKVYTVDRLIAGDDRIDDPATGVSAGIVSVIEMNCAREYLDAIGSAVGDDGTARASVNTLAWLSKAASARAWRAFDLGYPSFDAALFR